jgi:hypothetical protein
MWISVLSPEQAPRREEEADPTRAVVWVSLPPLPRPQVQVPAPALAAGAVGLLSLICRGTDALVVPELWSLHRAARLRQAQARWA